MEESDSLKKLVSEARRLRDHLLRVEGQDSTPLGIALQPFEGKAENTPTTDEEIAALAAAFQKAHDSALNSIDGYTLNEVLLGRSPYSHRTSPLGSFSLTALGVVLVMTAFFYSNWASRATFTISEAEDFISFDHFNRVMKLVELEAYFEDLTQPGEARNHMEPQLLYLEGLTSLSEHYNDEVVLLHKMGQLIEEVNVVDSNLVRMRVTYCRADDKSDLSVLTRIVGSLYTCVQPSSMVGSRTRSLSAKGAEVEISGFREQIGEINKLQQVTMELAGRRPLNNYVASYKKAQSQMQVLTEWLNVVHLWALPIIYGALGSIVYCMWRVLNPNLAAVGGLYAIMRTAFAGLAALTLSMLLVPSNVLAIGVDLNRPLVYLLSFIFGYSVEGFVSTLNMLNTYLSHNLTPKPRRAATKTSDRGANPTE
ncbi:hypothetical protein [Sulfitobacter sp. JB4-11]|uniref:hypothetical protein n=1 Tax=Sulfitobacter rhodophyticola TaxID=3238304 RepID=UPI003D8158BB